MVSGKEKNVGNRNRKGRLPVKGGEDVASHGVSWCMTTTLK